MIAMPVLIEPNVGPARISVPSASSRCRRSKCTAHTARSSSVIVAAKFSTWRVDEVDPFGHRYFFFPFVSFLARLGATRGGSPGIFG